MRLTCISMRDDMIDAGRTPSSEGFAASYLTHSQCLGGTQ